MFEGSLVALVTPMDKHGEIDKKKYQAGASSAGAPGEASGSAGYTIYEAVGCEKCNHTGYKGRLGIYEGILVNDPAIEKVLDYGASDREIALAAVPQAILTMKQDGMIKIVKGVTSIDELRRVIEID